MRLDELDQFRGVLEGVLAPVVIGEILGRVAAQRQDVLDAGLGVAIVLKSATGLVPSNHLTFQEIADPALSIKKAIIWNRNRYLSSVARNFLACLLAART